MEAKSQLYNAFQGQIYPSLAMKVELINYLGVTRSHLTNIICCSCLLRLEYLALIKLWLFHSSSNTGGQSSLTGSLQPGKSSGIVKISSSEPK